MLSKSDIWRCLAETTVPWWRMAINWVCGIEKKLEPTAEQKAAMTSLDEQPLHRTLCNVNALALTAVAIFFWAFFA